MSPERVGDTYYNLGVWCRKGHHALTLTLNVFIENYTTTLATPKNKLSKLQGFCALYCWWNDITSWTTGFEKRPPRGVKAFKLLLHTPYELMDLSVGVWHPI